jgi:hypothetical protein
MILLSLVTWIPRGDISYTTDLSGIYNIITVDDKSTWVSDCDKDVIRQINIDNDNITTTKQISCDIFVGV